jgi:hypothetical protein
MRHVVASAVLVMLAATPAFADATAFIGSTTTPANRATKGVSFGVGLLVVAFEFEYADTAGHAEKRAPALRTGMGNILLQTPVPIAGMQFYVTTGGGGYRETLAVRQETHIGLNTGAGVKVSLLGPVRARLDYRVFNLRGEPLHARVHRVYAGLNIAF